MLAGGFLATWTTRGLMTAMLTCGHQTFWMTLLTVILTVSFTAFFLAAIRVPAAEMAAGVIGICSMRGLAVGTILLFVAAR